MIGANVLTIILTAVSVVWSSYIQNEADNSNARKVVRLENFVPLVAFECGYQNKYMSEKGEWVTDVDRYATCLTGKLDILKYCRKVYKDLDITNIVEYSHQVKISNWCKEEGSPCKWSYTVRPYRCIVGEFHSEALQVPHGCRFGHVNDQQSCETHQYWRQQAKTQCESKTTHDGTQMAVRSFAILEPCGIDVFNGVEYVCCPVEKDADKNVEKVVDLDEKKLAENDDDDDDEDDDDIDYSDEDDDEDDEEVKDDGKEGKDEPDPYFAMDDKLNEHERYKEAEQRLDRKHRTKIDKVMREWSELEERYKKMKKTDEKGAEAFKAEMTERFQKTVASLEEENKEQKKQIEEVHEERVKAVLNERKRQATHDYRQALAMQVGKPNKHNVLKTLKAYIRAEEKDRTHMLNHYRHLLHVDQVRAETYKSVLLHRLNYIDLRINGTLAMLRDFPDLERKIRSIAVEFWADYRRENTPIVTGDEYTAIGTIDQYEKLLDYYKDFYNRLHNPAAVLKKTTTTTAAAESTDADSLNESADSDDRDNLEDEDNAETEKYEGVAIERVEQKVAQNSIKNGENQNNDSDESEDEDEDDISDDDKSRELHVEFEPIVSEPVRVHDVPPQPAYAKLDSFQHDKENPKSWPSSHFVSSTPLFVVFLVSGLIVGTVIIVARRRTRPTGFIEVDVCTPEERHVNGMQVNGYENPTYTFFDGKP